MAVGSTRLMPPCLVIIGCLRTTESDELAEEARHELPRKMLRLFLIHMYRASTSPAVAHLSKGFYIDKYNGKPGLMGLRLLNLFCPFWKAYYGQATKRGILEYGLHLPNYCHAYRPGFRSESAMMTTRVVNWILRQHGIASYACLKGMTNALQCPL